jgi:FkbM family methyltransferase
LRLLLVDINIAEWNLPRARRRTTRRHQAVANRGVTGVTHSRNAASVALPPGLRLLRRIPLPRKLGLLERMYGRRLAPAGVAWVQTASGPLWKLDLRNPGHRWIVYGDYEGSKPMGWLRRWLGNGGIIVDSGANIGQTVLYFAPLPGTRVYAFEPLPEAADWLQECVAHQSGWDVEIVRQGLSDKAGEFELLVPVFETHHGAQATLRLDWYGDRPSRRTLVSVTPLDDFLEQRKIPRVRLWKLDVEGWELHALRGASRCLERRIIEAVYVETSSGAFMDVRNLARSLGWELFTLDARGRVAECHDTPSQTVNLIMLPKEGSGL